MTLKLHNVPAMPTLAMLGDNGGVVTVNPEWCDWYELVFGVPAGEGYIKGREIIQQIDGTFSEFFTQRSEAVKSAVHSMMSNDPNRPTVEFRTIAEAKKSFELSGKRAMDYNILEEVFMFDGYFSVKDMEAVLFIRRAEELVDKAKEKFGPFFNSAAASVEDLDVNQLMQVLNPRLEVTDIDSTIFAAPVVAPYKLTDIHGARGVCVPVYPDDEIPTGNDTLNRMLKEGGGLRRGDWPGEVSARTAINRTAMIGGTVIHCFEKGDDDFPMLMMLINRLYGFETIFAGAKLEDLRLDVDAPWAGGGQLCFKADDGFYTLLVDKTEGPFKLASIKLADNGVVVVFEHNSAAVGYHGLSQIFEVFNDIDPEKVKKAIAAIKVEHGE